MLVKDGSQATQQIDPKRALQALRIKARISRKSKSKVWRNFASCNAFVINVLFAFISNFSILMWDKKESTNKPFLSVYLLRIVLYSKFSRSSLSQCRWTLRAQFILPKKPLSMNRCIIHIFWLIMLCIWSLYNKNIGRLYIRDLKLWVLSGRWFLF